MPSLSIAVDSEFIPNIDNPTHPLSVQISSQGLPEKFYIHPQASEKVKAKALEVGDVIFKSPFAPIDYFGWEWELITSKKYKNYSNLDTHIFVSFKDIEFLCSNIEFYKTHILPHLSRTRRISSGHLLELRDGNFFTESIPLPLAVKITDKDGKQRWHKLSLKITDISAMQGSESLNTYAQNVGIRLAAKSTYTAYQKAQMDEQYINNPKKFKEYALGDTPLLEIKEKTIGFYNKIAELVNVNPKELNDFYGLSTGKIVASLFNDWLCQKLNVSYEELYKCNHISGSEGITGLSKTLKNRNLIYLAMVDGGRAAKERRLNPYYKKGEYYLFEEGQIINILRGTLVDIDIAGCYGNGLLNQFYAVGMPTVDDNEYMFSEWEKKYKKQRIPGLWIARISWENAPFNQDLLISKTSEAFSAWDWVINGCDDDGFSIVDDGNKVYDAAMRLTTNSIFQASLNHDLLQTLRKVASNQEWGWILKNAKITGTLIYQKKHEVTEITLDMKEGAKTSEKQNVLVAMSKDWVRIDLHEFVGTLLKERKKYPKKTPLNTFLKLIINTLYGCIASEFFSVKGACVSNVVVGNNITARARCLAWLMAKGFHSAMSVTDGGVFDVNKVLKFRSKSLHLLEQLYDDNFVTPHDINKFCDQIPLLGYELKNDKYIYKNLLRDVDKKLMSEKIKEGVKQAKENALLTDTNWNKKELIKTVKNMVKAFAQSTIDKAAWLHLKSEFSGIDLLDNNQFSFETKDIYSKLILHSKVDYLLKKSNGEKVIAWRGMPKIWNEKGDEKIDNPISLELFEAIENGKPIAKTVISNKMLSLAEYKIKIQADSSFPLLPHDQISKTQIVFSHSPKGNRYPSLKEFDLMLKEYDFLKNNGTALDIAKLI